ncbi:MAG: type II toxin-antitoxin system VapC family toxin [Oscillospiraceae bacterium]|nr:type II toxin-antitoxin system VapC family toxin [Oscillospiraceae bacterium]
MMRYMLDTNICIYAIKHRPPQVLERLKEHEPSEICISAITYAELVHGVEKSAAVEKNRLALTLLLSNIEIIDFDSNAANEYGNIRAALEKAGTPIGPLDMMIAGHARSISYTVVTNNVREFERVSGLRIENWAEEMQLC